MAPTMLVPAGGDRPPGQAFQLLPRMELRGAGAQLRLIDPAAPNEAKEPPQRPSAAAMAPMGDGWSSYAWWNNATGTPVGLLGASFKVPAAPPAHDGHGLLLMAGMQNYGDDFGSLLAVLQWGETAVQGGPWWSISTWYVLSRGRAFASPAVRVNPGDALRAELRLTGRAPNGFSYSAQFVGHDDTTLRLAEIPEMMWCHLAVEAPGMLTPQEFPQGGSLPVELELRTGDKPQTAAWTVINRPQADAKLAGLGRKLAAKAGGVEVFFPVAPPPPPTPPPTPAPTLAPTPAPTPPPTPAPTPPPSAWTVVPGLELHFGLTVVTGADNRLHLFGDGGSGGDMWHNLQTGDGPEGWTGWKSLGGVMGGPPAAGRNKDGRMEAFVRGTDGALWHNAQPKPGGQDWGGWASLGGRVDGVPGVNLNQEGLLEVFVNAGGKLRHIWQSPGRPNGWSDWGDLGGDMTDNPAVGRNADGRLEVFVRAPDGSLRHICRSAAPGGWTGWMNRGGAFQGSPVVGFDQDGRMEVLVLGKDGGLEVIRQVAPSSGWTAWAKLGGQLVQAPSAAVSPSGQMEVFALGGDGKNKGVMTIRQQPGTPTGWSAWSLLPDPAGAPPSIAPIAARGADGRLHLFAAGEGKREVLHRWQKTPNGEWS